MTKKEWASLRVGSPVKMQIYDHIKQCMVNYSGNIVRFNKNYSQAFVKWQSLSELWYGRTEIEIDNSPQPIS